MIPEVVHTETNHNIDDLSAYELWQLVHYGSILPASVNGSGKLSVDEQYQADRMKSEQWVNDRLEKIMDDHWNY